MQDFLVILQPNTYKKKKQPQLYRRSLELQFKKDFIEANGCLLTHSIRRRGHLALAAFYER